MCAVNTITEQKPLDGKVFADKRAVGKWVTPEEVMHEIEKEIVFFDESGGGVTFSGGEPIQQFDFLLSLLKACREKGIHTALDTSGYCNENMFRSLIGNVDLFLYDLKLMDNTLHKKYTGVSNRVILKNLNLLSREEENVIIRFPVVPGITNTRENVDALKTFLTTLKPGIKHVHLLPFHNTGKGKYERFNIPNRMNGLKSMDQNDLEGLITEFEEIGFEVRIGG